MLAHFLALGDEIKARIETDMAGQFKAVRHAADLAGVKDSQQPAPACHIVFMGPKPGAQLPRDSKVAWDQEWMTVVLTRSAKDAKSGKGAMDLAGPLCSALVKALSGWTPDQQSVKPLEVVAPGAPPLVTQAGTLYVPLRWRARIFSFN